MRLTRKESLDYNIAVDFITAQTELSMIDSYLKMLPIKTIAMVKVLKPVQELMHAKAAYLAEDLERLMVDLFTRLCTKHLKEFEAMHKTLLGFEKMNNLDDARTIVRLMLKLKSYLGALVIRIFKQLSSDWRIFFVKTLPALKKQYT